MVMSSRRVYGVATLAAALLLFCVPARASVQDPATSDLAEDAGKARSEMAWSAGAPGTFTHSIFRVTPEGLVLESGGEQLAYSLAYLEDGSVRLSVHASEPVLEGMQAVVFDRGVLRERYVLRAGGVEQLFELPSRLGDGDMVIRGALRGPALDTRSTPRYLVFGPFTVNTAVAVDAAGRSLDLDMVVSEGMLELRVPKAWLDSALFPLTIDPFFTTATPIDLPATSTNASLRASDVAYNATANEYFVVYGHKPTETSNDLDIFGRRINGNTGLPIGAVIPIEVGAGAESREASVAWNPSNNTYLVAFVDRPLPPSLGSTAHIRGRILNASGADTGTGKFSISALATTLAELWPDCACDGSGFLVAWGRAASIETSTTFNVHAQRVSATGTAVGGTLNLETGTEDSRRIAVSFLGGTTNAYLVAWSQSATTTSMGAVKARRVNGIGTLGTVNTLSSVSTLDHDWPRIAANPTNNEWVVVWDTGTVRNNNPLSAPSPDLNYRRVGSSGTPLGGGQQNLVTGTSGVSLADVTWSSVDNNYVVIWAHGAATTTNDSTLLLARLGGGTGTILETPQVISATAGKSEHLPAIGAKSASRDCLIAWGRIDFGSPLNIDWFVRGFQTSVPPLPPVEPEPEPEPGDPSTDPAVAQPTVVHVFEEERDRKGCLGAAGVAAGSILWLMLLGGVALFVVRIDGNRS